VGTVQYHARVAIGASKCTLMGSRYNIFFFFFKAETMGVVIEICIKHPGGRTRIRGADIGG
jgi:hypothetical protein